MIEFLMENFRKTYKKRTTYGSINIDYFSRTEIIRNLFTKEKQNLTNYSKPQQNIIQKVDEDTRHFEFFDKIKQDIIPGISPNICKVAEVLLEMCKPDKVKTAELVNYIIIQTPAQKATMARKYLKKNIY